MRARVAGKERMAQRTAWQLDVGPLRLRCVFITTGVGFLVQVHNGKTWKATETAGPDPAKLLRGIAGSVGVTRASELVAARARRS
jgi:hypothetical protein